MNGHKPPGRRTQALAALTIVAALGLGTWWLGAEVAGTTRAAMALTAAWFAAIGVAALLIARRRRELRLALGGTYLAVLIALLAATAWTSRETIVDEKLDTGVPASEAVPESAVDDLLAPQP